jgi:hypothetical protein
MAKPAEGMEVGGEANIEKTQHNLPHYKATTTKKKTGAQDPSWLAEAA